MKVDELVNYKWSHMPLHSFGGQFSCKLTKKGPWVKKNFEVFLSSGVVTSAVGLIQLNTQGVFSYLSTLTYRVFKVILFSSFYSQIMQMDLRCCS